MKRIHYKSDFKLFENGDLHTSPFELEYSTTFGRIYKASYIEGVYTNCSMLDDGRLMVIFDNHGLPPGILRVTRRYYLTDKDFHDGICDLVSKEDTGVILTTGKTDECEVEVQVPPHYMQGEPGKSLTWDDMTEEQKTELANKAANEIKDSLITATQVGDTEYDDFYNE